MWRSCGLINLFGGTLSGNLVVVADRTGDWTARPFQQAHAPVPLDFLTALRNREGDARADVLLAKLRAGGGGTKERMADHAIGSEGLYGECIANGLARLRVDCTDSERGRCMLSFTSSTRIQLALVHMFYH